MNESFEIFTKNINTISRLIKKIKHAEMTKLGLKGMHVMCLYFLNNHSEGLTAAQLSEMCCEDKATISRSVCELKKKGLIEESQGGSKKYRSIIKLTDSGRKVADCEAKSIVNAVVAGGNGITDNMRSNMYLSLSIVAKNLSGYAGLLSEGGKK